MHDVVSDPQQKGFAALDRHGGAKSLPENQSGGRWARSYLLVLAVTFAAYARTLRFDFVYDDRLWILRNPALHSWRFLSDYFTKDVWAGVYPGSIGNYYRPVFMLWMRLQVALFGSEPVGYHFAVVSLHLFVTLLVYFLALRIAGGRATAICAALIFGLHPIHIESVAWIAGATDPLVSALLIASFLCWLRRRSSSGFSYGYWTASLGFYALALLAKETALVFPLVIAAHEWLRRRVSTSSHDLQKSAHRFTRALKQGAPYLVVMVLYGAARVEVLKGFSHPASSVSLPAISMTWPSLIWFWTRHLIWPVGLSTYYNLTSVTQPTWANFTLPLLGIVGAGSLLCYGAAKSRVVAFAAPWLLFPLIPLLDLKVLPANDFAHDRFLYLPSVGFAILVAFVIQRLPASRRTLFGYPANRIVVTTLLSSALAVGTILQSSYFRNDATFYTHNYQAAPNNLRAKANYAALLGEEGKFAASAQLFEQVVARKPDDWSVTYNLGLTYYKLNRPEDAVELLSRAVQIAPGDPEQYLYLGLAELKLGRNKEAEAALRQAIALRPQGYGYHFALGTVLKRRGMLAQAMAQYRMELEEHPENQAAQQEINKIQTLERQKP